MILKWKIAYHFVRLRCYNMHYIYFRYLVWVRGEYRNVEKEETFFESNKVTHVKGKIVRNYKLGLS